MTIAVRPSRGTRDAGIDSLRVIAVLGAILDHSKPPRSRRGPQGVSQRPERPRRLPLSRARQDAGGLTRPARGPRLGTSSGPRGAVEPAFRAP